MCKVKIFDCGRVRARIIWIHCVFIEQTFFSDAHTQTNDTRHFEETKISLSSFHSVSLLSSSSNVTFSRLTGHLYDFFCDVYRVCFKLTTFLHSSDYTLFCFTLADSTFKNNTNLFSSSVSSSRVFEIQWADHLPFDWDWCAYIL